MNGLNGPKGDNFDESYVAKSMSYNTLRANRSFILQRADWQVTRLAIQHGLYSGMVYGGSAGLVMAIYKRQMRYIPMAAAGLGVPYAAFLAISTVYRMDV